MSGSLSDGELRAMLNVVEDGRRDAPNEAMPWAVLDRLFDLIPCDDVGFSEFDVPHRVIQTEQFRTDGGERLLEVGNDHEKDHPYWSYWHGFPPCARTAYAGGTAHVVLRSDFYTSAQLRSTAFYSEVWGGAGPVDFMTMALPAAPGRTRRILLYRDRGPQFGERDRLVLELLRPHLYDVYLDARRRGNGAPRLSAREQEVLRLAAQGYRNADIARQLVISVGTVRKHMEHIFDRTGVRSRAAAAALALPQLGLTEVRW